MSGYAPKGHKHIAQGNALGIRINGQCALQGQKR